MMENKMYRQSIGIESKMVNADERRVKIIATDESVDDYNEIVTASGWDLERYKKASPVFVDHKADLPNQIGSADPDSIRINEKGQMEMEIIFSSVPLAQHVLTLYDEGHAKSISVGYRVKEYKGGTISTDEGDKNVTLITKKELYEVSFVGIGSNPNALAQMKSSGVGTAEGWKALEDVVGEIKTDEQKASDLKAEYEKKLSIFEYEHSNNKLKSKFFARMQKAVGHIPLGDLERDTEKVAGLLENAVKNLEAKCANHETHDEPIESVGDPEALKRIAARLEAGLKISNL